LGVDLSQLHGILKDKNRARILELLDQRGSISYVELLNLTGILHTGSLNYHLKVLGDLLAKDELTGRYSLSEKGKVAVELLGRFQTVADSRGLARKSGLRGTYIMAAVGLPIIAFLVYQLNPSQWYANVSLLALSEAMLFYFYGKWSKAAEAGKTPFSIRTTRAAMITAFAIGFLFLNIGLLGLAEWFYPVIHTYSPALLTLVGTVPGAATGAFVGDVWGRRRNYEPVWWPL